MKNYIFLSLFLFLSAFLKAQNQDRFFKVPQQGQATDPSWVQRMYTSDPDVFSVDSLYRCYYQQNSFRKNIHTQNYKHWRKNIQPYLQEDGKIRIPSPQVENTDYQNRLLQWQQANQLTGLRNFTQWNCIGPYETYNIATGSPRSNQVNVYCVSQSKTNPDILFAGTEAGGIYKTINKGLQWTPIGQSLPFVTVNGIEIDPTQPDIVYASANNRIYKTIDGGLNWVELIQISGEVYEFLIDPLNNQKIFAVGNRGLHFSNNGGASWTNPITQICWDIKYKPGSQDTIYLLKNNAAAKIDELFRSDDGGITWNLKNNGYYTPTVFAEASAIGGKIAVSAAAPQMVYVALIGNAKVDDDGWIGLFRSDNSGDIWTNPSGQTGGPYNTAHPYMVGYSDGYHQGFYNFDLEVSDINPAKIWVASIFFYTSSDSGRTFTQISPHPHADHQDMEVNGTDIWVATDGGLDFSNNELSSFQSRKRGITGSDYWRLGSGWNEDVLVGGRYHNGDAALFMPYWGQGESLFLGAAEQGTGYVHPMNNRLTFFSDLGSSPLLPYTLNGAVNYYPELSLYPNEGYTLRRSELVFDCRYASTLYLGKNSQFWRSTDQGVNFTALHNFGNNRIVMEIEQSRSNPAVIYCSVFNDANSNSTKGEIHKSTNGGITWTRLPDLPATYRREYQLAINPENENELWVGNTYGNNGQKIYRSLDGGQTWINMSSTALNGQEMRDLIYQPTANGGLIYVATYYGVFYYDPVGAAWNNMSAGLPFIINTNEMQAFFKDNKIRLGAFGRAIWEAEMIDDTRPLAQPITYNDTIYCERDTSFFDCYSILNQNGCSWQWSFSPSPMYVNQLNIRNPKVVFGNPGSYEVSLTITDGNGNTHSKTIQNMVTVIPACNVDTIPGQALRCMDTDDYAQTGDFNLNTNTFTITAWVKPEGIQPDYAAIAMNDGTNAAGFNFRGGNNTLGYHWPGGQWWWNSGLIVRPGEWSHVAMVANGNSMTLYVNGIAATQNIALSPTQLTSFKIGNYRGWTSRTFNGQLDELTFWNRALTMQEIRGHRHLTKELIAGVDSSLIAYYQFNQNLDGQITDKVGNNHISLANGSLIDLSTAPLGCGTAAKATVNAPTTIPFVQQDLRVSFGSAPQGDIWINKIRLVPDSIPNTGMSYYWIINNYGSNPNYIIDSLRINLGNFSTNPSSTQLYTRRDDNAFLNQWQMSCNPIYTANDGQDFLVFDQSCGINQKNQIYLTNAAPTPIVQSNENYSAWVYPNPMRSEEFISVKGLTGKVRFRLFGLEGKLIQDLLIDDVQAEFQIKIPNLSDGNYFYSIENENIFKTGKIQVKN
jgi:photosystem II stability/assembly factor-like uncharacterized protein